MRKIASLFCSTCLQGMGLRISREKVVNEKEGSRNKIQGRSGLGGSWPSDWGMGRRGAPINTLTLCMVSSDPFCVGEPC
jgi:hypothetical protein